jgi:hypothetical protein
MAERAVVCPSRGQMCVKVRIKKAPDEREIDGISLKGMIPGAIRDVSSVLGSWLITEGYADSEMRQLSSTDEFDHFFNPGAPSIPRDRRARKR